MWEDPIVAEVHRTRAKLVAESNFDVEAFFADVRTRQAELGDCLVRPGKTPNQVLEAPAADVLASQDFESHAAPAS